MCGEKALSLAESITSWNALRTIVKIPELPEGVVVAESTAAGGGGKKGKEGKEGKEGKGKDEDVGAAEVAGEVVVCDDRLICDRFSLVLYGIPNAVVSA